MSGAVGGMRSPLFFPCVPGAGSWCTPAFLSPALASGCWGIPFMWELPALSWATRQELGCKQDSGGRHEPCNFKAEKLRFCGLFISFLKPGRISPLLQEDTLVKTDMRVILFVIVSKDFVNSGCALPTWGACPPCASCCPPALPWASHGGDAQPQAWQPRRVLRGNFPYLLARPRTRLPEA